jgi:hypothetical protein
MRLSAGWHCSKDQFSSLKPMLDDLTRPACSALAMHIDQAQRPSRDGVPPADQHEAPTDGAFEGNINVAKSGLNASAD